ncbi:MAG TPA: cupin domain-containing protein [Planctomycetota bacterium]|nr:cupin domain-containing protein [Planctomycetota bacterium]
MPSTITHRPPFVRARSEWTPYEQDEPPGAAFHFLLKTNEVPGLTIGHVELTGPIQKTGAAHQDWEQVYLVLEGQGHVHLDGVMHGVEAGSVVSIPKNTWHFVEVAPGETLKYVYINQHR